MGPGTTLLTNIASGVDGEACVSSEIGLAALLLSGTTAIGEDGTANLLLMVFVMAAVSFADTSSSSYIYVLV